METTAPDVNLPMPSLLSARSSSMDLDPTDAPDWPPQNTRDDAVLATSMSQTTDHIGFKNTQAPANYPPTAFNESCNLDLGDSGIEDINMHDAVGHFDGYSPAGFLKIVPMAKRYEVLFGSVSDVAY